MAINIAVIGAGGFAGIEAVRLIANHPSFCLTAATSNELAGKAIEEVYPAFAGITQLHFTTHESLDLDACEVAILAVPHGAAMKLAPSLVDRGIAVVDLSADFRFKDVSVYEQWYIEHTAKDYLAQSFFGLPELFKDDLAQAAQRYEQNQGVLVGCAGCYPTATSLAGAPALRNGYGASNIIVVDAISGVAGAGRKPSLRTHFCFADENLEAYGVATHRHTPEIEQILDIPGRLVFTPHLAPLNRGLLSTVTIPVGNKECSTEQIQKLYEEFYEHSPFVNVLPSGVQPRTASVAGTNYAHVGVAYNESARAIIATCAIDNVGKGAAGQGIQCANIVCGLPETSGLQSIAIPA